MAKTKIPEPVQRALWAAAAGRCEYRGCNDELIGDLMAGKQHRIYGFVAHIVADAADGPRGDSIRSPLLAKKIENLMLMCAKHHKLIDVDGLADHPEELLLAMKAEHEERVRIAASIDQNRASHVIRFGADIGKSEALVSTAEIFASMLPDHYPASFQTIDLEMIGCSYKDHEPAYWEVQQTNLQRKFADKVRGRIERQEIRHLSVFALGPQPLLIELGRQLGDITTARIHQRHREPQSWRWQPDQPAITFSVQTPDRLGMQVELKLALSGAVVDERITTVLGEDVSIWSITTERPHNDILRRPEDQAEFRRYLRSTLDAIKARHGEDTIINVFPALPNSAAIDVGRVWMPKADLPMKVYDQNRTHDAFIPALEIRC